MRDNERVGVRIGRYRGGDLAALCPLAQDVDGGAALVPEEIAVTERLGLVRAAREQASGDQEKER